MLYRVAVCLLIALACSKQVEGFAGAAAPRRAVLRSVRMAQDDPTGSPFVQAINSLQEAIQTSPVAKLKSGLAKLQAGDYDVAATKAKLNAAIDGPVPVMFSFTT